MDLTDCYSLDGSEVLNRLGSDSVRGLSATEANRVKLIELLETETGFSGRKYRRILATK